MSSRDPLRLFGVRRDDNIKPKIAATIKEIELHRRELENLRIKLEQRRKSLFDTTVKAMVSKDRSKASVYANEWAELRKVAKVVYVSELALTQVELRLESIVDVGDVMSHMNMAFKVLRRVSKTVQGLVPALDQASTEINNTLAETMTQMGNVSPTITLDIKTDSGEELVEQARLYAEQKSNEIRNSQTIAPGQGGERIEQRIAMLAAGEEKDDEAAILGVLYSTPKPEKMEEQVLQYATIHDGRVDVTDASTALNMPPDEIEQAMLKLLSEGRVKVNSEVAAK